MAVLVAMYWVYQHVVVCSGKGYHRRENQLGAYTIAGIRAITYCTQ